MHNIHTSGGDRFTRVVLPQLRSLSVHLYWITQLHSQLWLSKREGNTVSSVTLIYTRSKIEMRREAGEEESAYPLKVSCFCKRRPTMREVVWRKEASLVSRLSHSLLLQLLIKGKSLSSLITQRLFFSEYVCTWESSLTSLSDGHYESLLKDKRESITERE